MEEISHFLWLILSLSNDEVRLAFVKSSLHPW